MKLTSEEMRTLYQQQTLRSPAGRDDCLSDETMVRAAAQELNQSEREKTADHLMVCSDCAEEYRLLRELKPWADQAADSMRMPGPVIKPVRMVSDNDHRPSPSQPGWIERFFGIFSPGMAAYATAAAFLVISLACIAWVISLRRENARITAHLNEQRTAGDQASGSLAEMRRQLEDAARQVEQDKKDIAELRRSIDDLSQPFVNVPVEDLELDEPRGGQAGDVKTVTVPAGANLITLLLRAKSGLSFPDYALEVIDEHGKRVFRVTGLRKSEADGFNLALPRWKFPAGRYRLRLYGLRAGKSESVGDYSIHVRYR